MPSPLQARQDGDIACNLQGIAIGNGWVSPLHITASWPDFLLFMVTMMTSCHGNAFRITSRLWGESWMLLMRSVGVFFVILNKLLSKQSSCGWFETPWEPCDVTELSVVPIIYHACIPKPFRCWLWQKKIISYDLTSQMQIQKSMQQKKVFHDLKESTYCLLVSYWRRRISTDGRSSWWTPSSSRELHGGRLWGTGQDLGVYNRWGGDEPCGFLQCA